MESTSGRSRFCSRTTQPRDSSPGCPRDDERAGGPRADFSFAMAEQWDRGGRSGAVGGRPQRYQGRRSGDQFCVYVGDRYVLPALKAEEREAIAAGTLSMDQKIRDYVRAHFSFRYVEVDDYATAKALENAVKAGNLGDVPYLNP